MNDKNDSEYLAAYLAEQSISRSANSNCARITRADLDWWFEFAARLEWTFAKTYAKTAPHHYVVEGRTPGVTHEDMVRAARVIHTFGTPGKYYALTKIYLVSPDGRYRWWTEDSDLAGTTLVNRATTELFYGIQNAPSTHVGAASPFDELASTWDAEHPAPEREAERVRGQLAEVRGTFPPHVLDLGCGTGRVLDLGLVSADRYAGVDSSQAMLNLLIHKHPKVAAIYPTDVGEALAPGTFTPGQFDWAFLDAAVDLSPAQRLQVRQIARLALIEVDGELWQIEDTSAESANRIFETATAMRGAK